MQFLMRDWIFSTYNPTPERLLAWDLVSPKYPVGVYAMNKLGIATYLRGVKPEYLFRPRLEHLGP